MKLASDDVSSMSPASFEYNKVYKCQIVMIIMTMMEIYLVIAIIRMIVTEWYNLPVLM